MDTCRCLQMQYFFSVIIWGSSIRAKVTKKLNRLMKKAQSAGGGGKADIGQN